MSQPLELGRVCFTRHRTQETNSDPEVASPPKQVSGCQPWALDLDAGFQTVIIEGECWVVVRWIAWRSEEKQ